jgi:hypothetical protein
MNPCTKKRSVSRGCVSTSTLIASIAAIGLICSSANANVIVGGVSAQTEDIIVYDSTTSSYSTFFDGSNYGLSGRGIDAFHVISADEILLSFDTGGFVVGVGSISPQDIFSFSFLTNSFSLYFDGSDVGLGNSAEGNVDAISLNAAGDLILSTAGNVNVSGVSAGGEDLLVFTAFSLGSNSSGVFSLFQDGSSFGLDQDSEDIDALFYEPISGNTYMSTQGDFEIPGLSGAGADVFVCENPTSCASPSLFFDASAMGAANAKVNSFSLNGSLSYMSLQRRPIPEPMSLALMLVGLAGIVVTRRRFPK